MAPPTLFYSYAHEDEVHLEKLQVHLSMLVREKLISSVWYDRKIVAGTDWAQAIDTHLERATVILLLVSPDFLASDYCYAIEMQRALHLHDSSVARVIPVLLRPCDWNRAPFARLQCLPGNGQAITLWNNQDQAWNDVAVGIRRSISDLPLLSDDGPHAAFPHTWNIPYPHNPFFTGRVELLARLSTAVMTGQAMAPQAICGLGGIGKTQIAVEYAYRHRQNYQAVLWALADTRESLVSSYVTIAKLLELPQKDAQEQQITIEGVKTWLQTHHSWLLILDDADDLAVVRDFLPAAPGGHILLTTRAQATGRLARRIEVDTMPQEVAALFLLRRAKLIALDAKLTDAGSADITTAREICGELGGLPLALDQAGAYIEETQCSLTDYQQRYRRSRAHLLRWHGKSVEDHPDSVAATWSLAFEKVEQTNSTAADLLRLCVVLHPDAIPVELITGGRTFHNSESSQR